MSQNHNRRLAYQRWRLRMIRAAHAAHPSPLSEWALAQAAATLARLERRKEQS